MADAMNYLPSDDEAACSSDPPEKSNPLKCQYCRLELCRPVRLSCQHYFCRDCLIENKCPLCGRIIDGEAISEDRILSYVIETSSEATELCANCDKILDPMYFCDTCQQPLCTLCKEITHQAKIFAAHQISLLEESWKRGRLRGGVVCTIHNEPFLLFCLDSKKLMCIECFNSSTSTEKLGNFVSIDLAHKICCDKLEKAALKMRLFQDDVLDQIELRKKLAAELDNNLDEVVVGLEKKCAAVVDEVVKMKEHLLVAIKEEKLGKEQHIREQLKVLELLQDPLKVNLLSASIFCSYAPKMDLLYYYSDLSKAIQLVLANKVERLKFTSQLSVDFNEQLSKLLNTELGLMQTGESASPSLLRPIHQEACSTPLVIFPSVQDKPMIQNGNHRLPLAMNGQQQLKALLCFPNGFHDSNVVPKQRRIYRKENLPEGEFSVHLLGADLNATFNECLQKVDLPLKKFVTEIAKVSKTLLSIQRDITLRRCVVNKEEFLTTISGCEALKKSLEDHALLIQNLQPLFRDIWQEQMERIHRQQNLFREKLDDIAYLQKFAEKALSSALQLKPFAFYMASVISMVDSRRTQLVSFSPMEQICLQISSLEPDSQQRIEAIEKEEESRRLTREQERLAMKQEAQQAKENLKEIKTPTVKMRSSHSTVVENSRDRSSLTNLALGSASGKKKPRRENRSSEGSSSIGTGPTCCSPSPQNNFSPSLSLECSSTASTPPLSLSPIPPPPPPPPPILLAVESTKDCADCPSPTTETLIATETKANGTARDERPQTPQTTFKFIPHNPGDAPSTETVKARDRLLESIKERVKRIEPFDEA